MYHGEEENNRADAKSRQFGGEPGQDLMWLEHSHGIGNVMVRTPDRFEAGILRNLSFFGHATHCRHQILIGIELRRDKEVALHAC